MKKLILGFSIFSALVVTGCSNSTRVKTYHIPPVHGSYYEKSYILNHIYSISVGEKLLQVSGVKNGIAAVSQTLISPENIEIKWNPYNRNYDYSIKKGEVLTITGETYIDRETYYLVIGDPDARKNASVPNSTRFLINTKTLELYPEIFSFDGYKYSEGDSGEFSKTKISINTQNTKFEKHRVSYSVVNPKDGVNFDIVYNGISGDTLRFTYREFTNGDLARPAFFQDLTYNKNDKFIKFKGIEIEILKVTSSELTYKIVRDGMESTIKN